MLAIIPPVPGLSQHRQSSLLSIPHPVHGVNSGGRRNIHTVGKGRLEIQATVASFKFKSQPELRSK